FDFCCFFFFQAEDGIRDGHVTGVQTCALPIFLSRYSSASYMRFSVSRTAVSASSSTASPASGWPPAPYASARKASRYDWAILARSEERRVGKECRGRVWWWRERKADRVGRGGW